MRLEVIVEMILNQAGLDTGPFALRVMLDDAVHVLGKIDDDGLADGLAGETGSAAAGKDSRPVARRYFEGSPHVFIRAGDNDAHWLDAVHAGVGAVKFFGVGVEANLALDGLC